MSSAVPSPLPQKQELPKEIWRIATTLSDDAQNAAMRKARELGFDLNRGRIPLAETLINLSHNRDVVLDAVDKQKLAQLPLKLQYLLLSQTQKVSEAINALVNGTDSLLSLEDSVDDLTSTIWQFNLHNLSDQVLGFSAKMNQLKAQETLIRQVHREAQEFEGSNSRAHALLGQIEEAVARGAKDVESVQAASEQISAVAAKVVEQEQKVAGLVIQAQQHDSAAAQYAANAKTAAADVEATANKTRSLQAEVEATGNQFTEVKENAEQWFLSTKEAVDSSLQEFQKKYETVKDETQTAAAALREALESATQESAADTTKALESALSEIKQSAAEARTTVDELVADTGKQLEEGATAHESRLAAELARFNQESEAAVVELKDSYTAKAIEITKHADDILSHSQSEHARLVAELDSLEGRIREAIERATGYTLFHSFQKRQLDLAKSKKLWGIALASAVGVSLFASGAFIYALQFVQVYNAAFYLKLSISLPIIYAIAFCSIQYSRERRLEEEYAFKSTISISLEPYQKLVEQLIDKDKPEERAKYSSFIIESVNRVFTSPTERIFDEKPGEKNSAEKIIKAVGDVIEPLTKAIKK